MHISIILAHPDPKSFNHAIAKTAVTVLRANGHKVFFHDLYKAKTALIFNTSNTKIQ
jgi:NAD(P)H dehydrogenase (quinone)